MFVKWINKQWHIIKVNLKQQADQFRNAYYLDVGKSVNWKNNSGENNFFS